MVQPRLKGDYTPHVVSRFKMRWGNTSTPHTSLHICTKATIRLLFFFSAVQLITQFSKPTCIFYAIWTTEVICYTVPKKVNITETKLSYDHVQFIRVHIVCVCECEWEKETAGKWLVSNFGIQQRTGILESSHTCHRRKQKKYAHLFLWYIIPRPQLINRICNRSNYYHRCSYGSYSLCTLL